MAANPIRRNNRDRNGPNDYDPTEEGHGDWLAKQLELHPLPINVNNRKSIALKTPTLLINYQ